MAITIHQNPANLTTSDNDVIWVFSSDKTTESNFEFKIELFINNASQGEEKVFPIKGNNGYYNASETIKTFFNEPFIPTEIVNDNSLIKIAGSYAFIYIKITEVYGAVPAEEATLTSSTIDIIKGSLSDNDWIDTDLENYRLEIGKTNVKFLTSFNRDNKYWVDANASNYISAFIDYAGTKYIRVRVKDVNGVNLNTTTKNFNTLSLPTNLYNINVSLSYWDSVNLDNAYYYEVTILDTNFNTISEYFNFYVNRPCVNDRTVYFINKFGGIDSWIFSKKKTVSRSFNRKSYKRTFGNLNTSSYTYSKFTGRKVNYLNNSEKSIKLLSDWNDAETQSWLVRELLESPLIWMEDSNGVKTRYNITTSTENEPVDSYVELVNLEIDLSDSLLSKSVIY